MRSRRLRRVLAAAVLAFLAGALAGSSPARLSYVLYDARALNALKFNDDGDRRKLYDAWTVLASVQGIANRDKPRLLINYHPRDQYWYNQVADRGGWLARSKPKTLKHPDDFTKLIALFRSRIKGLVVWDPKVCSTVHVASTVAGADDLISIRYDPDPRSVYTELRKARIPVKVKLVNEDGSSMFTGKGKIPGTDLDSTGSAKCDAYRWAVENYIKTGKCDPTRLGHWVDAFWLTRAGCGHHNLCNHDFIIAKKGMVWDLSVWDDEKPNDDPEQPLGTDRDTLLRIFRACYDQVKGGKMIHQSGFVPWHCKYTTHTGGKHEDVPTEWRLAQIATQYNVFLDADAHGPTALVNASFYMHFPLKKRYTQGVKPTVESLRRRGFVGANGEISPRHYICFYAGDYDAAAWFTNVLPDIWDDKNRGKIPLAWPFNPNLSERAAHVMDHVMRTRTPNDWFVAGDCGAGYVNPGGLKERPLSKLPSAYDVWAEHNKPFFEQFDLTLTGFIIDGYSPGLDGEGKDCYLSFSPDGIVPQKVPVTSLHKGMPILRMNLDLPPGGPDEAVTTIRGQLRGMTPQFLMFRSILKSPTWHVQVVEGLRKAEPQTPFEIVDPYTLLLLVKSYEESRRGDEYKDRPEVSVELGKQHKNAGLRVRPNDDGRFEAATRGGKECVVLTKGSSRNRHLYLDVAEAWAAKKGPVEVEVEYYDEGEGEWNLQYDSEGSAYEHVANVRLANSRSWKTADFKLPKPRFDNRMNAGSDLRIFAGELDLHIRRVTARR